MILRIPILKFNHQELSRAYNKQNCYDYRTCIFEYSSCESAYMILERSLAFSKFAGWSFYYEHGINVDSPGLYVTERIGQTLGHIGGLERIEFA